MQIMYLLEYHSSRNQNRGNIQDDKANKETLLLLPPVLAVETESAESQPST